MQSMPIDLDRKSPTVARSVSHPGAAAVAWKWKLTSGARIPRIRLLGVVEDDRGGIAKW